MEEQKEQKRDPALEVENHDAQVEVQTENQTIIEVDLFQGKTPTHTVKLFCSCCIRSKIQT